LAVIAGVLSDDRDGNGTFIGWAIVRLHVVVYGTFIGWAVVHLQVVLSIAASESTEPTAAAAAWEDELLLPPRLDEDHRLLLAPLLPDLTT